MLTRPLILICYDLLAPLRTRLEAEGYEVALSWEMTPEQAARAQATAFSRRGKADHLPVHGRGDVPDGYLGL